VGMSDPLACTSFPRVSREQERSHRPPELPSSTVLRARTMAGCDRNVTRSLSDAAARGAGRRCPDEVETLGLTADDAQRLIIYLPQTRPHPPRSTA